MKNVRKDMGKKKLLRIRCLGCRVLGIPAIALCRTTGPDVWHRRNRHKRAFSGRHAPRLAFQPDGKLVTVGGTADNDLSDAFALARFNADGSLDHGFGTQGIVTARQGGRIGADVATAVALQRDGKIVVAGYGLLQDGFGPADFEVVRYLPNGAFDPSFGIGGRAIFAFPTSNSPFGSAIVVDEANALAIQGDGKILLAGTAATINGAYSEIAMARLNTTGKLDSTFGAGGEVLNQVSTARGPTNGCVASAMILQKDGRIVIGGAVENNSDQLVVLRYQSNGQLDNSFASGGKRLITITIALSQPQLSLAQQADGKIVVGAYRTVRLTTSGMLDSSFGSGGFVDSSTGTQTILARKDGDIILAGGTSNQFGIRRVLPFRH